MGRDGAGFDIRSQGRDFTDSGRPIAAIVADYVKTHSPLASALDGRIRHAADAK